MIDPSNIVKSLQLEGLTPDEQMQVLQGIQRTIAQSKKIQRQENIKSNVNVVIDLLKKIEADIRSRYDEVGNKLEARVASIRDGVDGKDGKDGAPGRDGRDGPMGPRGQDGRDGKDGVDGQDGVSVTDAKIDFDGSLIIKLSTGREINVGEVVAADLAEKIRVTMSTNSAVAIQDEGTTLTSGVRNINFVGANITATASGDSVTVSVAGGSGSGTVTSVNVSGGTTGLTTSGGPVTTSGTITLAGTLAIANGGTGQTTRQDAMDALAGAVTSGQYLRGNGTDVVMSAIQAADVPTLNQNTTGTASNVTGVVALANGGSGQTTAQTAMNAFAGAVTSGSYLRGNGTNVVMATIQAADVPTLNQNTTGTASNVTGTVAIANGGTGQTTANAAFNALAPSQATNSGKYLTTDGTNTSWATVSGGGSLIVKDEGSTLTSAASSIDFVGAGVTATAVGGAVTVTIPGGGGGSSTAPKALLDTWMIGAF